MKPKVKNTSIDSKREERLSKIEAEFQSLTPEELAAIESMRGEENILSDEELATLIEEFDA